MKLIISNSLQCSIKYSLNTRNILANLVLRTHRATDKNVGYMFSSEKKGPQNIVTNESQNNKDSKEKEIGVSQIQEKYESELEEITEQGKKYSVVSRNYKQQKVPGLETRRYSNLSQLQQDIVKTNTFDIQNPQIVPKTGASNSYVGIASQLTQISLGAVKVKGHNEAFLSQVDPQNIPADLDIRFDSQKQLKIVGKQGSKQKAQKNSQIVSEKEGGTEMKIQPETIQQKTLKEHMQQQFGIGIKSYGYSNVKNFRRWDIFLSLLAFALLIPIQSTLYQLHECYKTTKAIEQERMKEITQLKHRSYQRVLLQNKDFRFPN